MELQEGFFKLSLVMIYMIGKTEKYILEELEKKKGLLFAVIDPIDYKSLEEAIKTAKNADAGGADAILVSGSTGVHGELLDSVCKEIKKQISVPLIIFPGNIGMISRYADAIYFMSLLNSRNPYWITGAQTLAAPIIKQYNVEPLPVGYIVVEPGGTVGWVSDAKLMPRDKPKLTAAIALASQYMGAHFVITDAGSAPKEGHIPLNMVSEVANTISVPYIVAGGIKTPEEAKNVIRAGADIIQVGTAFEEKGSVDRVKEMVKAVGEGAKIRGAKNR
jgi:phosphoglycerol geranylgeranyltransferase